MIQPRIVDSARKHGVSDEIIPHAFNNPLLVEDLDERMTMFIGPDQAGNLYEIGVVGTDEGPIVVHAMKARPKYLR
ncbi:MAG TPA: hypothetical protein VMS99_06895 [Acidimicrobiia bacterium]|nr:hypothetical protein [Acidimicrobiia bacterium]